jgi:hypothetical protein
LGDEGVPELAFLRLVSQIAESMHASVAVAVAVCFFYCPRLALFSLICTMIVSDSSRAPPT